MPTSNRTAAPAWSNAKVASHGPSASSAQDRVWNCAAYQVPHPAHLPRLLVCLPFISFLQKWAKEDLVEPGSIMDSGYNRFPVPVTAIQVPRQGVLLFGMNKGSHAEIAPAPEGTAEHHHGVFRGKRPHPWGTASPHQSPLSA